MFGSSIVMRAPYAFPLVASRILFFGGDTVSLATLRRVHERAVATGSAAAASLVVVRPQDPPQTKSGSNTRNVVGAYCSEQDIPQYVVDHPKSIRASTLVLPNDLDTRFDVAVVCSCRYFLPNALLERMPPAINMHPSLLPKYRGASPIYETLRRGDTDCGVSVIKLEPREPMDCGDVLLQRRLHVPADCDLREYLPQAAAAGADAIVDVLDSFASHWQAATPQDRRDVHFTQDVWHAGLVPKDAGKLDFRHATGEEAYNLWRAYVSYLPLNALLIRTAAPCGAKIRTEAKKRPVTVTFNEAMHPSNLCPEVLRELELVAEKAECGAAYFPYTRNMDRCLVGAIRCRTGWFCFSSVTVQNSRPVDPKTLAATLECKPGYVYNGVFDSLKSPCPTTTTATTS
jgi:methionyl-tRNA formyltransferase